MTFVCELVTDRHGIITRASPGAASLFAIDDRWLLRKPLATFVSSGDRQRFRTFLVELGHGGEPGGRMFLLENRNGLAIPAELVPTRSNGGLSWSVTADTEFEEPAPPPAPPLAGTERLFERLLNRLPTGVVIVDRRLRIAYANPAARRFIASDAIRLGEPLPDPWPQFALRSLVESMFTHNPQAGRHLVDTGERVLQVEGLSAGHVPTVTLLIEDVTEREHTRQVERRFVENAAHELRTPLAAIASVVEVLEAGAKDDAEARDRFLAHLRVHSQRLVRLATSLLMLARIQTGREQPHLDLVPVLPLLDDVASGVAVTPGVEVRVDSRADLAVLADSALLCQALENVAANAAKHTQQGSIVFTARDLGRTIEIELADTGAGMRASDALHAFDRFYRSRDGDGDGDGDGFGLGLAIADEAVRAMGGTIKLDSDVGTGTRVRIGLPSARLLS